MPKEYARSERVSQTINRHLAMIMRNEVSDPRVSSLTITEVQVTKDLRQAKIFVTDMSQDAVDINNRMEALNKANGFIRRELAARIEMRHCPNLIFAYDNSIAHGAYMSELIDRAVKSSSE
ncbi:MAG: 30S ribosome-binding factor RbfA [Pseudomonadota bacterium]